MIHFKSPINAKTPVRLSQILNSLLFITMPVNLFSQSYDSLNHLEGYHTKVYYSDGSLNQTKIMAGRCDQVLQYYNQLISFEPTVTLLVLSSQDWSKYTGFPVYGMPHYTNNGELIVASEDNEFWKSFIPPIEQLPKDMAQQIKAAYSDQNGNLSMQPFFDLLAVHELGHGYHIQGGLTMQRKWMGELFSNILLHTYVAENEPNLLPALTIFPKMVVSNTNKSELKFTTLNELEDNYAEISQKFPNNYGWYQCRWHVAAADVYNGSGLEAFKKLWLVLKTQKEILDDSSFAALLSVEVSQSVADVPSKWDEK